MVVPVAICGKEEESPSSSLLWILVFMHLWWRNLGFGL